MFIWAEKYRPKNLEEFIGNDSVKSSIENQINQKEIGHLLFYGKAGTGKTSLAKIIVNSIECSHLIINASSENSVDVVRQKLTDFASILGFHDLKILILDECLEENTLVSVLDEFESEHSIPISKVDSTRHLVKSKNINTDEYEWKPFEKLDKGTQDLYEIEFENGKKVKCTSTHKWYTESGIVNTSELKGHVLI